MTQTVPQILHHRVLLLVPSFHQIPMVKNHQLKCKMLILCFYQPCSQDLSRGTGNEIDNLPLVLPRLCFLSVQPLLLFPIEHENDLNETLTQNTITLAVCFGSVIMNFLKQKNRKNKQSEK